MCATGMIASHDQGCRAFLQGWGCSWGCPRQAQQAASPTHTSCSHMPVAHHTLDYLQHLVCLLLRSYLWPVQWYDSDATCHTDAEQHTRRTNSFLHNDKAVVEWQFAGLRLLQKLMHDWLHCYSDLQASSLKCHIWVAQIGAQNSTGGHHRACCLL